jgi:hypothetical protein
MVMGVMRSLQMDLNAEDNGGKNNCYLKFWGTESPSRRVPLGCRPDHLCEFNYSEIGVQFWHHTISVRNTGSRFRDVKNLSHGILFCAFRRLNVRS